VRRRIWALITAGALALVFWACASGGGATTPEDREFVRKCEAQHKVAHIEHRGNSVSRTCKPAPQPSPNPGDRWQ
jgi:hypothetical protein